MDTKPEWLKPLKLIKNVDLNLILDLYYADRVTSLAILEHDQTKMGNLNIIKSHTIHAPSPILLVDRNLSNKDSYNYQASGLGATSTGRPAAVNTGPNKFTERIDWKECMACKVKGVIIPLIDSGPGHEELGELYSSRGYIFNFMLVVYETKVVDSGSIKYVFYSTFCSERCQVFYMLKVSQ